MSEANVYTKAIRKPTKKNLAYHFFHLDYASVHKPVVRVPGQDKLSEFEQPRQPRRQKLNNYPKVGQEVQLCSKLVGCWAFWRGEGRHSVQ